MVSVVLVGDADEGGQPVPVAGTSRLLLREGVGRAERGEGQGGQRGGREEATLLPEPGHFLVGAGAVEAALLKGRG